MISIVHGSGQRWEGKDGVIRVQATLLSTDTPASLEISGADVDGMADDEVIAAGSVLITPSKNYIAFTDGEFTEKG